MYNFIFKNDLVEKSNALKATIEASASFDSNVFYIDDDIVPEADRYMKSNTQIINNLNSKAHLECQETLEFLRETMEKKDDEISKSLFLRT